jgi:glycosyltransferase involved in cell wall biosynthesis
MTPRVIIGSPLFNHAKDFRQAIESILAQTYKDFALVLVDDCSTDETPEIAREYVALDPRVTYIRNEQRLGLIDNCQKAFAVAREMYPQAEYFAWASDHDLWHPRWLQQLVDTLDREPDVVLAYPQNRRIGPSGETLARKPWAFETYGTTDRWERVRVNVRRQSAGNMVYGLYRIWALAKAGVYRHVLIPDRLLMTELALYGQFKQVPQVLWFRRWYGRVFSLGRQRKSFFPGRRPLYAYAPWWISHGVSLFWILTVRGEGQPQVSRSEGALVAVRVLAFSGLFHAWQTLRGWRFSALERLASLKPYERRLRLMSREIMRRGIVDWTSAHMKQYVGAKVRRRFMARVKKRVKGLAFEAVRRPGLLFLAWLRMIPVVRNRVIPSLLKHELDQIPAAPSAEALKRELQRLQKTDAPILIGPWVGEVGYELLYWIPFLNWALKTYGLDRRRLIAVSRGGARPWYRHLTDEYVDVFELFSLDEYRQANEERWDIAGHQKQYRIERMDRDIAQRACNVLGLQHAELLHPSFMYQLLRFYWFEKAGVRLLTQHTEHRPLAPVPRSTALSHLPNDYIAARFYFRPSFPDTPENRRFASDVIRSISRDMPVVLLNTGLTVDDHEDLDVSGMGVYHVDHLMTLERNLELQTEVISRARGFVGTYGGLAYLAPLYGVPSISFYSTDSELVPAHLDIGWRLGRSAGVPVAAVHTRAAGLMRVVLGGLKAERLGEDAEDVQRLPETQRRSG